MQVDITNVLEKIKEITAKVNDIDAQDVKPADMKAMTHFKQFTDGIIAHIELYPDTDPAVLKEVTDTLTDYRTALNEKHGEAQGKNDFIAEKYDDIHLKLDDLHKLINARLKAKELAASEEEKQSDQGINAQAINQQPALKQNSSPEQWHSKEFSIAGALASFAGTCIAKSVSLPLHVTAGISGTIAGLVVNTVKKSKNSYDNKVSEYDRRMVKISPEESYSEKNSEQENIRAGTKLRDVMSNIAKIGAAMGAKGYGVIQDNKTGLFTMTKEKGIQVIDFNKKQGAKLLENLSDKLDTLKQAYLDSCICLSEKSKEKMGVINGSMKNLAKGMCDTIKDKSGSFHTNVKGVFAKIADSLQNLASKIQKIIEPEDPLRPPKLIRVYSPGGE